MKHTTFHIRVPQRASYRKETSGVRCIIFDMILRMSKTCSKYSHVREPTSENLDRNNNNGKENVKMPQRSLGPLCMYVCLLTVISQLQNHTK